LQAAVSGAADRGKCGRPSVTEHRSRPIRGGLSGIEEEIFYPALKEHPRAREIVLEAYEEHNVVDTIVGELEGLRVDDETWGAKAKVMQENIELHIEEEETEMFAQARRVFDREELESLGERMAERKERELRRMQPSLSR
jgi:hemerythrin-like domain-containing protein